MIMVAMPHQMSGKLQEQKFLEALNLIKSMKVKGMLINYNQLRGVMYAADKIACRINGVRTVALLVCRSEFLGSEGKKCAEMIRDEVFRLEKLQNACVKTVKFYHDKEQELIGDVTCGQEQVEGCSGYLVEWAGSPRRQFKHVRDHITFNEVATIIKNVLPGKPTQ